MFRYNYVHCVFVFNSVMMMICDLKFNLLVLIHDNQMWYWFYWYPCYWYTCSFMMIMKRLWLISIKSCTGHLSCNLETVPDKYQKFKSNDRTYLCLIISGTGKWTGQLPEVLVPVSLSLSQRSPLICWVIFLRLWPFFYSICLSFIGVGLPAYLSNHNPFFEKAHFCRF